MIDVLLAFIQCFTNFLITYLFLTGIFAHRFQNTYVSITIVAIHSLLLALINSLKHPLLNTVISLVLAALMVVCLFSGKISRLIFAGLVADAIIIGCEFIPLAILSALDQTDVFTIVNTTIQNVSFSFISTGVYFIFSSIAKFLFYRKIEKLSPSENRINIALLPLPMLSIAIVYYVIFTSKTADLSNTMIVSSIIIVFLLLVVNYIVFLSDQDSRKKYEYRSQIAEMQLQSEMKELLILQQENHIRTTNALIHDFKNQLRILQELARNAPNLSSNGTLSSYINDTLCGLSTTEDFTEITCDALRCILLDTSQQCREQNIKLKSEIYYSDFNFIAYQDICIIFSNALDNAIRECKYVQKANKSAEIYLSIQKMNQIVFIQISNTKVSAIREINGQIQTTKDDSSPHGLGLSNIERSIKKYNGTLEINYTDNKFILNILFTIPQIIRHSRDLT